MTEFVLDLARETAASDRKPGASAFRTILAGAFAAPGDRDRLILERMLAVPAAGRSHRVLPGCAIRDQIEQAETQLLRGAVDIVLLDLNGPVSTLLALVGRLRAAARETVVFVGVLPAGASTRDRLYLTAVIDAMVERPLLAGSLHRAIADAIDLVSDFDERLCGSTIAGSPVRH